MDHPAPFGAWLKQRRKALDLTQARLAGRVGCAAETIRKIEAGRLRPSHQIAARLAEHLDIPAEDRGDFVQRLRALQVAERAGAPLGAAVSLPKEHGGAALPLPLTPLVGRATEVANIWSLLTDDAVRLLTLVGPPGVGKTRLSLQVALELQEQFTDGVSFVALAPISEPELILSTIAQKLEVTEVAGTPLLQRLADVLHTGQMLLVLDNFEQVVVAAPLIGKLLAAAPRLKVLVTSRTPLHIYGEHEYAVPPLGFPGREQLDRLPAVARLGQYEAVRLFVQRARAVNFDFRLTRENAQAVAAICRGLDGLPLAIELAAVRMKMFTPRGLLDRLNDRLDLLATGPRDVPVRQRTLRGAIDWSYELLSVDEQRLFRALAVFVGGFTIDAATQVCGRKTEQAGAMVDALEALLDHSLVRREHGPDAETRFGLLETIREYAAERLAASGEAAAVRRRHAEYYLAFAETAVGTQDPLANRLSKGLDRELDNFRATLQWSLTSDDALIGLRLAELLSGRWAPLGLHREGRRWLEALLAKASAPTRERGGGLLAAAYLALRQGEYAAAEVLLDEGLALALQLGDGTRIARAHLYQGMVAHAYGDHSRAISLYDECLVFLREAGDTVALPGVLRNLGDLAYQQGDIERARRTYEETLAVACEARHLHDAAYALRGLGHVARATDDLSRAVELYHESLQLFQQIADRRCVPFCIEGLACVASGAGAPHRAARLLGAAEALREAIGVALPPAERSDHDRVVAAVQAALDQASFSREWRQGAAMTLDQAIMEALSVAVPARE